MILWRYLDRTQVRALALSHRDQRGGCAHLGIGPADDILHVFSGLMAELRHRVDRNGRHGDTAMVRDERLMDVIATTVIGGTSVRAVRKRSRHDVGLLLMTVLGNSFNLLGVSPPVNRHQGALFW